jgi:hypothetical protein
MPPGPTFAKPAKSSRLLKAASIPGAIPRPAPPGQPRRELCPRRNAPRHHAIMPGNLVCHSMVVRLKFLRPGSPQKAAAIEPFSRAILGTLNEITRRREIVWRHVERTERRHDAHIDLVWEPLDIVDEPPLDQKGDCVQGPGDRSFRRLVQGASISSWKHDDPRRSEVRRHPNRRVAGDCAVHSR